MIYRTIEENLHFINSWCKKVRWTQYPSIRRSLLRDECLCNFCSWCISFCLQSYGWKQSRKLNRDFQICCFSLSTRISEASKYQSKLSVLLDMSTQTNHRWAGTWVRLVPNLYYLVWDERRLASPLSFSLNYTKPVFTLWSNLNTNSNEKLSGEFWSPCRNITSLRGSFTSWLL